MKQTYTFRFETKLHALLKSNAAKVGVSMSDYIEAIMLLALKKPVTVDPATRDEILEQVVADLPEIHEPLPHEIADTHPIKQPTTTPVQFY